MGDGIGRRIREAREAKGLTQAELASLIGTTPSAVSNYEKGVSHPKEAILYKLIKVLEVDANFLFQDEMDLSAHQLTIPNELKNTYVAFDRGEFEDLTQDEVDALAVIAKTLKAQRKNDED
jgi:transcriptional regulator with XRE-family HTH domain